MRRGLFALAFVCGALALISSAHATMGAKLSDKPVGAEVGFVQKVSADLNSRYSTPAQAEAAGYFRYNNEDDTGAISYVNLQWDSSNQQPSQLWYDVNGKLLGADYSIPLTSANSGSAPNIWGVNPQRWNKFGHPHVHYILKMPDGTMKYGLAVSGKAFTGAGGDLSNPQPATIVKLGKATSVSQVAKVFTFPAQWDLELWVTPNPNGAFADKNPLVHPSKNAQTGDM
jgi:hypothetical protein